MQFLANVAISIIFSLLFIITFDRKENFEFRWFHRKDLVQIYQTITYFRLRIHYFIYKKINLSEKWKKKFSFAVFFKYFGILVILLIPMIASEKSHQNLSDYIHFLLKKRFEVNKKSIFLVKKCEIHVFMIMLLNGSKQKVYRKSVRDVK